MTPRALFERAHALIRAYDDAVFALYAADAVLEMPFAPPGLPRRVEGRDAIRALLAPRYALARASGRRIGEYRNVRLHETTEADTLVAEFEAVSVAPDGAPRVLAFIHVYRMRGDSIAMQRDYFDSLAMVDRLRAT